MKLSFSTTILVLAILFNGYSQSACWIENDSVTVSLRQVNSIGAIANGNKGYIEINVETLQPGMYIYSLIVDGVELGARE